VPQASERSYLLVLDGERARLVELYPRAPLTIGRDPGCAIVVEDAEVAPAHARISVEADGVVVEDLGAPDATRVGGEPVRGRRVLQAGDLLAVGHATIELRSTTRVVRKRRIGCVELRRRADDELERALRYGRPLSLVVVRTGGDAAACERAADTLASRLRALDVLAVADDHELWVLLPETPAERAQLASRRFLEVLAEVTLGARLAFAGAPEDGGDLDALVAAARRGLQDPLAATGRATPAVRRLELGDRQVVVADPAMTRLFDLVERLARTDLSVLIEGETGTGKELVAEALHAWSRRAAAPLVRINCAALPDTLVESELFGHEKGAFSGADAAKPGRLESASGGTVLLDEVADLAKTAQAKLLRVLEERHVTRLGGIQERPADVRIVAATNCSLRGEVDAGRFRADLFFRLGGGIVRLPALRDRRREIVPLARTFLVDACRRLERGSAVLSAEAVARLEAHPWPGNVRELKNVMELVAAIATEPVIEAAAVDEALGGSACAPSPPAPAAAAPRFRPIEQELRELERARMATALEAAGGNQTSAAALIEMPIRTWYTKAKLYGLPRRP
jgi:DNA-binding NtrC family response regulator